MNTSILCILLFTKLFFSQFTRSWIKTRSMSPSEQLMSSGKSVCARARFVKRNIAHTRATHTHDTQSHTHTHTHTHTATHTLEVEMQGKFWEALGKSRSLPQPLMIAL